MVPTMTGRGVRTSTKTDAKADDEVIDEAVDESFPASDPPAFWSGVDSGGRQDAPGAVPEADSPELARAWEESGSMEGPAPTG